MVRLRCESTWERLLVPAFVTIWMMVKPTAFTQVRRSYTITVGTLAGLGLLYCAPPLLLARGIVACDVRLTLVAANAIVAQRSPAATARGRAGATP